MSKDKKIIIVSLVLLAAVVAAAYFYVIKNQPATQMAAIKDKTEKFINEQLVPPGTNAKIKSIVEDDGVYKIVVTVGSQDLPAYITKDGKEFFPQAFDMTSTSTATTASPTPNPTVSKTTVPSVELFVMSYCPYGVQMEKGILPVLATLGSKINFSLKFVDYSLHGDQEIKENLTQYCVQQQGTAKLTDYLNCFDQNSNSATCLSAAKIDTAKVNSCVSATDSQYKITQNSKDQTTFKDGQYPTFAIYAADNAKYNVTGSPTLVINGTTVSPGRDSQSLLTTICSAFSNAPSECSKQLSSAAPAAGFGDGTGSASTNNSSCGN